MNDEQRKAMFAGKYDSMSSDMRARILEDVGIPKKNFEPYTRHDVIHHANFPYRVLDKKLQNRIAHQIEKIEKENERGTKWEVILEDPRKESGTTKHIIRLGKLATEHEVKNALMRMHVNGRPMYYEQDLKYPYLHSIKELKS